MIGGHGLLRIREGGVGVAVAELADKAVFRLDLDAYPVSLILDAVHHADIREAVCADVFLAFFGGDPVVVLFKRVFAIDVGQTRGDEFVGDLCAVVIAELIIRRGLPLVGIRREGYQLAGVGVYRGRAPAAVGVAELKVPYVSLGVGVC